MFEFDSMEVEASEAASPTSPADPAAPHHVERTAEAFLDLWERNVSALALCGAPGPAAARLWRRR
ncbi:MAG: hypothetical protein AAGF90_04380 [Pseudomonadota bacterium]